MSEIKNEVATEKNKCGFFVRPEANIYENQDEFQVVMNLPGVEKEDLDIAFSEQELKIIGTRKDELVSENFSGYKRSFKVNERIDVENIQATLENGRLAIRIPKAEESKPRSIPVQVV